MFSHFQCSSCSKYMQLSRDGHYCHVLATRRSLLPILWDVLIPHSSYLLYNMQPRTLFIWSENSCIVLMQPLVQNAYNLNVEAFIVFLVEIKTQLLWNNLSFKLVLLAYHSLMQIFASSLVIFICFSCFKNESSYETRGTQWGTEICQWRN